MKWGLNVSLKCLASSAVLRGSRSRSPLYISASPTSLFFSAGPRFSASSTVRYNQSCGSPHPWGPGTPVSSALRNLLPKSPCVGEERRAGLGQALPSGSPIVGSKACPYRRYCGQHTFAQGAVPLAATAVDVSNVKVSDEDAYLSRNMKFKTNNRIVKELTDSDHFSKITQPTAGPKKEHSEWQAKKHQNRAKLEQSCRQEGWVSACVSRHWHSVVLQCERNRSCTLSSTCGMSLME